jgi:hypothetical protein
MAWLYERLFIGGRRAFDLRSKLSEQSGYFFECREDCLNESGVGMTTFHNRVIMAVSASRHC